MHGCLDRGQVKLLTRTGLDWTDKYPTTVKALNAISTQRAYIDAAPSQIGIEARDLHRLLCGVWPEVLLKDDAVLTYLETHDPEEP